MNTQAGGGVTVREVHIDDLGIEWSFNYRAVSEAAATTTMNARARDLTNELKERDFEDLLAWVQAGNPVSTFSLTDRDITEAEGEDFITVWFAENPGSEAISVAWWIESLGPPAWTRIANRIGYTTPQRADVQDRAIDLTAAEPRFDLLVSV